jgi:hypothetical protein
VGRLCQVEKICTGAIFIISTKRSRLLHKYWLMNTKMYIILEEKANNNDHIEILQLHFHKEFIDVRCKIYYPCLFCLKVYPNVLETQKGVFRMIIFTVKLSEVSGFEY